MIPSPYRLALALCAASLPLQATDPTTQARDDIIATYQKTFDAMRRGDADAAFEMDTADWVSITVGQKPRTRQEIEPQIRRDTAGMRLPPDWSAFWKPDYPHNGTGTGIQIYEFKLDGATATVLYLVGATRTDTIDGAPHRIWRGSHIRDTWMKTPAGWKRRMHEKLTVSEQLIDGRPVNRSVTR